jgi:hypothetical protein
MAMGDFVEFYKGNFRAEYDEIEQNGARWSCGDDPFEVAECMRYLENVFDRASPELLTDTIWRDLYNSGSWRVRTFEDLFRNLQRDGVKRDVTNIVKQFFNGNRSGAIDRPRGKVECPIILYAPSNPRLSRYKLLGGNTRLTMARVLGIRPSVIILRTDW